MTPEMTTLLEQMRTQLKARAENDDAAWGPDSEPSGPEGEPGALGAENEPDVWQAFDMYIGEMVDDLMEEYELDEDGALDFIFDIADTAAAEGKLPAIPMDDPDDADAVAAWLGAAGSAGFERMVLDAAEAEASEGDEDSEDTED
jgi:hypothetical protein